MQAAHPGGEKGNLFHGIFCDIAREAGAARVCDNDIEVALVISDVENRCIFWNIFLPKDSDFCAGDKENDAECPLYNAELS